MLKRMRNNRGFTLIEVLVIIAVISVLTAVVIPTVGSATEKAGEATDLANARSAYAKVILSSVDADGSQEESFLLHQKKADWQSSDSITIGGITHLKGEGDTANWEGVPSPGGTCTVLYEEGTGVKFIWKEGTGSASGTGGNSWKKLTLSGLKVNDIGRGYINNDNLDSSTTEQKELVQKLKEYFGWDEITVAFAPHGNYKGSFLVSVPQGTYSESGSVNSDSTTRLFFDKTSGEIVSVWEQPGSWGTNGSQGSGFWGASGKQTVTYECDNIDNYR